MASYVNYSDLMKQLTFFMTNCAWEVSEDREVENDGKSVVTHTSATPVYIVRIGIADDVVNLASETSKHYEFDAEIERLDRAKYSDYQFRDEHVTYTGFDKSDSTRCYIGYDVETQSIEITKGRKEERDSRIISHQFYFVHNKKRLGILIISALRFTERSLTELLAAVVHNPNPKIVDRRYKLLKPYKNVPVKSTYLSAHFSLIEGGFLLEEDSPYYGMQRGVDAVGLSAVIRAELKFIELAVESIRVHRGQKRYFVRDARNSVVDLYKLFPEDVVEEVGDTKHFWQGYFLILDIIKTRKAEYKKDPKLVDGSDQMLRVLSDEALLWRKYRSYPVIAKRGKEWCGSSVFMTADDREWIEKSVRTVQREYTEKLRRVIYEKKIVPDEMTKLAAIASRSRTKAAATLSAKKELARLKTFDVDRGSGRPGSFVYSYFNVCVFHLCMERLKGRHTTKKWIELWTTLTEQVRRESGGFALKKKGSRMTGVPSHGKDGARLSTKDSTKAVEHVMKRRISFIDSTNYGAGSLADLGSTMGIDKLDLAHGTIEDMELLLKENPEQFFRYGFRDAVITAEATPFFAQVMIEACDGNTLPLATRIAGYTSSIFQRLFKDHVYYGVVPAKKELQAEGSLLKLTSGVYGSNGDGTAKVLGATGSETINLKTYLGWEYAKRGAMKEPSWWPTPEMASFSRFYYGGWSSCHVVGPYERCIYHDLMSAYPCAVLMLENDYDFSAEFVYRDKKEICTQLEVMNAAGPFQIAGVSLAYRFKDGAEPMFPCRMSREKLPSLSLFEASENLIFPKQGYAHVSWPEFWTASQMGLLSECVVFTLVTYPKLKTNYFSDEVGRLLKKRADPKKKKIFKNILNYLYGKTAQGVRTKAVLTGDTYNERRTLPGSLTCFPISAYTTSVCRAVMGELLNLDNECYAITTDGFISPDEDLHFGYIAEKTDAVLKSMKDEDGKSLEFQYIKNDFKATRSLFLKTRGYVLLNDTEIEADISPRVTAQTKSSFPLQPKTSAMAISHTNRNRKRRGESPLSSRGLEDLRPLFESYDNANYHWLQEVAPVYMKLARMGVYTERGALEYDDHIFYAPEIVEFLNILNKSEFVKWSWPSFVNLKKITPDDFAAARNKNIKWRQLRKNRVPVKTASKTRLNLTYDMKRAIDLESVGTGSFVYPQSQAGEPQPKDAVEYKCTKFKTKPLLDETDFVIMRMLAERNMTTEKYIEFIARFAAGGYGASYAMILADTEVE